jgi:cell division protein FtsB
MPRHADGERAMTGAERLRKFRERKRQERGPSPQAILEAENAALQATAEARRLEIATLRWQRTVAWQEAIESFCRQAAAQWGGVSRDEQSSTSS